MATDINELLANPQLAGFESQRKLAQALINRGSQTPQGQMIGNIYVGASPFQMLGNLAQQYVGQENLKAIDKEELSLAKALRQKEIEDLTKFSELQYGGKQIPAQAQAGPMPDGGNIPIGTTFSEPDPMAAFQVAAESQSPLLRSQLAEMLKGQKFAEGEVMKRYNPATGKMETTGQGTPKYHAPISIDTGNSTILLDPMTKQKIAEYPKAHQPVAGQVLETDNGPVLVNTRTGQAQPIMSNGQAVTGGKPLTEAQGNATAFGMRMKESNQIINELEQKGVRDTGITRSVISGVAGMTPFMGEKLQQGVSSAMNVLPSALGGPSSEQQQVDAARKNFITAVLRKESGAAISPSEFYTESQKYFPQVGDSSETVERKSHARETAIKAMEIQAGNAGAKKIEQMGAPKKVVNFNDLP